MWDLNGLQVVGDPPLPATQPYSLPNLGKKITVIIFHHFTSNKMEVEGNELRQKLCF